MRDLYVGLWVVGAHRTRRVLRIVFWPHVCALKTPSILLLLLDVALAIGVHALLHTGVLYRIHHLIFSPFASNVRGFSRNYFTSGLEHGAM